MLKTVMTVAVTRLLPAFLGALGAMLAAYDGRLFAALCGKL